MKHRSTPGCCDGNFIYNMGFAHDWLNDVKHYSSKDDFKEDLHKHMFPSRGEVRQYHVCIVSSWEQQSVIDWLQSMGWTVSHMDSALTLCHTTSQKYIEQLPEKEREALEKKLEARGVWW